MNRRTPRQVGIAQVEERQITTRSITRQRRNIAEIVQGALFPELLLDQTNARVILLMRAKIDHVPITIALIPLSVRVAAGRTLATFIGK